MSVNKPRGKPFAKGHDDRRLIGNREKTVSLTAISRRFLAMTPAELADEITSLRGRFAKMGKGTSTMAEIIVAAFLWSLANDPQPGNMRELWRRIDGEVVQPMFDVDPSKLTDSQLERLRNGESIESVLADAGGGRTGVPPAAGDSANAADMGADGAA